MLNRRGISRAVVLLTLIAVAIIIAIAVPVVQSKMESAARDADTLHEITAENSAKLRFVQEGIPFSAIYDCENKQFVDFGTGVSFVEPYGNSKIHEGKVLLVRVDESGKVYTKWVNPEDYDSSLN